MTCPECNSNLNPVSLPGNDGVTVPANQCPSCGGIWFDKDELYNLEKNKVESIDKLNIAKATAIKSLFKINLSCPRDNTTLIRFTDINFPKTLHILRCGKCSGFWFNHGDLSKYEDSIINKNKSTESKDDPVVDLLVENDSKFNDSLTNLSDFLTIPINRGTMKPESWGILPPLSQASDKYTNEAKNTYYATSYALRILFGLVNAFANK